MYNLRQASPLQMLLISLSLVCGVNNKFPGFQMTVTHYFPSQIDMIMCQSL